MIGLSGCSEIIFITSSGDSVESTHVSTSSEITTSVSGSSTSSANSSTTLDSTSTTSSTGEISTSSTTDIMRTECSLIAADPFDCLAGQVCIGDSFEEKGVCVDICINLCENPELDCVIWEKPIQLPPPPGIGVCI